VTLQAIFRGLTARASPASLRATFLRTAPTPSPVAVTSPVATTGRRVWTARAVAAVLPLAVVAAAAVSQAGSGPVRGAPAPVQAATAVRGERDVALVRRRLAAAVADADTFVLRRQTTGPGAARRTTWVDVRGGREATERPAGGPATAGVQFVGGIGTRTETLLDVDHAHRRWFATTRPRTAAEAARSERARNPAALVLQALDDRAVGSIERLPLGDRAALHLTPAPRRGAGAGVEWWVDAVSYLPIRAVTTLPSGARTVLEYAWLPRTATTLAHLRRAVPKGYARADRPLLGA